MDLKQLLEALIEANARHGAGPVVVYVVYPDGSSELLTLPTSMPAHPSVSEGTNEPCASETEQAVMRVLGKAEAPLKGIVIASRAGISYSSHLRKTLADLVRRGKVIKGPQGGYWPSDRALPDEDD